MGAEFFQLINKNNNLIVKHNFFFTSLLPLSVNLLKPTILHKNKIKLNKKLFVRKSYLIFL